MPLNEKQIELCETSPSYFSDLRAVYINFNGTCTPCHEAPGADRSPIGRSDALIEQVAELRALEKAARCCAKVAATLDELTQGEQEERHRRSDIHASGNHEGDTA